MFGLAARTPYVRIETRARNAVTTIWPDGEHARAHNGSIARNADAMMFGPHTAKLLQRSAPASMRALLARHGASVRKGHGSSVTLEELVDAGEAMLLEVVKLARQAQMPL